ncbi:ATP-binding protein involved in chromosome partitioning [Roseiarcus fermentans]|uniref:Iron-sulfur cluster carrier protein n=1 Tax=Roseiarcus fermentans TaxID=1473586 RepID=A0A366F3J4_9HYPH|nr:Mrp/NBP35 family ATP-binding protein [Roseiarcus fermentans]RBP09223.1 ATP-binding protein involved in chromosome partitioning [Roseiarcus fermentans]
MASRDEVMAALAKVPGPDGKTPLPDSGAISGLTFRDSKAFLAIAIDPDRARAMEPMRAAAEAAIKAVPGVSSAVVTLTAEQARAVAGGGGHAHDHAPAGHAPRAGRGMQPIPGVKRIIAVASGKGGVGKSTVACNLAVALARLGLAVGVLDADLFGPSMPKLFGLSARPEVSPDGQKLVPLEAYGVKVMSIGFLVDEGAAVVWRGPMVMSALTQLLREVAWGDLDVLVVDMPPGTGDTQLTMAQAVPLSGAVIVSTPQDLALIDARRGIAMFKQVQVPLIGVVENMSYFLCPHCGARTDVFSHGGARREAETLGVPFLGEVPLDIAIRTNSDEGRPIVATLADSAHAGAFLEIARRVAETLQTGAPGARPAPRIRFS